jgi:hypothetical protein
MTLHAPATHPRHIPHLRISPDLISAGMVGLALILIVGALVMVPRYFAPPVTDPAVLEARYGIEFRMGERASAVSEAEYLVDFRAAERDMR